MEGTIEVASVQQEFLQNPAATEEALWGCKAVKRETKVQKIRIKFTKKLNKTSDKCNILNKTERI